jgi:hypothetical protein
MKHFLTVLLLAIAFSGQSQILNYDFSTFTSEYSDLTNPTVITTETWDDPDLVIPVGFDFMFEGIIYNELFIGLSTGGLLIFQNGATTANALIAYSSDLIDVGYNDGEILSPISVQTSGTPGAQICKVEWKNCGFYNQVDEGIFPDRVSFQLWLYEGSNDIEIHFGPNTVKDFSVHDGWLTYGILQNADLNSGDIQFAHMLSGSSNNPTLVSTADLNTMFTLTLDTTPENGRVYRFASTVVSAPEVESNFGFNVYPTVTDGLINVQTSTNAPGTLEVRSISGQLLMQEIVKQTAQLDLSGLSAGCYFIRLVESNQTMKVIKQ